MSDHEPELKDEYGEPLMRQDLCKWLRGTAQENWWADKCGIAADYIERLEARLAPAVTSDKRQDKIVADEPQLSREQTDDMNSGD